MVEAVCPLCSVSMKYEKEGRYFVCEHYGEGFTLDELREMLNDV